ncbi:PIN domain-containing protein [Nakamurella aerolata]|uniref:Ribonuclease VapC n=1 Tax=Nakamurella aerolata TaxID=1656892 RepID=A0A849A4D2_9ACTN|nr:type II toxin-antitoxin system VapC family toxin [Nakamurella aerolata]
MIVDSSAVMAVLHSEPGSAGVAERLVDNACRMSVANWLEASIVVDHRSARHQRAFAELLDVAKVEVVPVTAEHAAVARQAYRRYGRGSGSAARLNFGDCFAYALAITSGEPLLFVGDDFSHTDVDRPV